MDRIWLREMCVGLEEERAEVRSSEAFDHEQGLMANLVLTPIREVLTHRSPDQGAPKVNQHVGGSTKRTA